MILTHGSLFSGIGGFDLAAQWAGFENIFQVEIDKFCQKINEKNFPNTNKYFDIKQFSGNEYANRINVISGGFPCQPFSVAGKRKGTSDDRALWGEMFRVIDTVKPQWIIAENVPGLLTIESGLVLEQCFIDLESSGYTASAFIIPALAKDAPHKRDRIWIVANRNDIVSDELYKSRKKTWEEKSSLVVKSSPRLLSKHTTDTNQQGLQGGMQPIFNTEHYRGQNQTWNENWYEVATRLCRVDDGVSNRVDRLKSLGNAIVPQVAYEIFNAIKQQMENDYDARQ
jgi:DNA (cytosine-5)-methyltransferase 1